MRFFVGVALVALAGLNAPVMAQSGDAKPKGVRMACKNEAVTGSFTRKARQCRHAVGAPSREDAKAKSQHSAAHTQPAPAATVTTTTATTPPAADPAPAGGETKGQ